MAKEITAFECDFCKRLFLTERGAKQHERQCRKNPCIARACYTCVHFENRRLTHDKDKFQFTVNGLNMHLDKNRCKVLSTFLFNPYRWEEDWIIFLTKMETPKWKSMPSAECGCERYEQNAYDKPPNYPTSHHIKSITIDDLMPDDIKSAMILKSFFPIITKNCIDADECKEVVLLLLKTVRYRQIVCFDINDIRLFCRKGGEIHAVTSAVDITEDNWGKRLVKDIKKKTGGLHTAHHILLSFLFPKHHEPVVENINNLCNWLTDNCHIPEISLGITINEEVNCNQLQVLLLWQHPT